MSDRPVTEDTFTCRTCPWFAEHPVEPGAVQLSIDPIGSCRAEPPQLEKGWPDVLEGDWCRLHPLRSNRPRKDQKRPEG